MTVLAIVALVVVFAAVMVFNTMIGRKNGVAFAFSAIDAMLKKRYDLIPNLVATCERYMGHEQSVLQAVTEARARAIQSADDERVRQEAGFAGQLKSVFAVAEGYPELKASESFMHLQRAITEVEEQIAAARRAYNAAVLAYNNACEMVPTNVAAKLMGYGLKPMFAIDEAEAEPVKVWRE